MKHKPVDAVSQKSSSKKSILKTLLGIFIIFAGVIVLVELIGEERLREAVEASGPFGPIAYILIVMIGAIFAPLAGGSFFITATQLFGEVQTFLLTFPTYVLGCLINYYIGSRYGEHLIVRLMGASTLQTIHTWEEKIQKKAWAILIFTPIGPDYVSYAAGLLQFKFSIFFTALCIGAAINIASYVFIGGGIIEQITNIL